MGDVKELCMDVVVARENFGELEKATKESDPDIALALFSGRMLMHLVERPIQRGATIFDARYKDTIVRFQAESAIQRGIYSGPATQGRQVTGPGVLSLKIVGRGLDPSCLRQEILGYFSDAGIPTLN